MGTLNYLSSRAIKNWVAINATLLWLGLLLPWIRIDLYVTLNPLGMASSSFFEAIGLGGNYRDGVFTNPALAFIFFLGIAAILYYATSDYINLLGITKIALPKGRALLITAGYGAVLTGLYAQRLGDAQGFSGLLSGYWFFGTGLICSTVFEFKHVHKKIAN